MMTEEQKQDMKGQIREIFMRNGFTVKDGQSDLKDYVYSAAYELIAALTAAPGLKPIELPKSFLVGDSDEDYFNQRVYDADEVEEYLKSQGYEVKS